MKKRTSWLLIVALLVSIAEGLFQRPGTAQAKADAVELQLLVDFEQTTVYTHGNPFKGKSRWIGLPEVMGIANDAKAWAKSHWAALGGQLPIEGNRSMELVSSSGALYSLDNYKNQLGNQFTIQAEMKVYQPAAGADARFGILSSTSGDSPALVRLVPAADGAWTLQVFGAEDWMATDISYNVGDVLVIALDLNLRTQAFTVRVTNKTANVEWDAVTFPLVTGGTPLAASALTGGGTGILFYMPALSGAQEVSVGVDRLQIDPGEVVLPDEDLDLLADFEDATDGRTAAEEGKGWVPLPSNFTFIQNHAKIRGRDYWRDNLGGATPIDGNLSLEMIPSSGALYSLDNYRGKIGNEFTIQADMKAYRTGTGHEPRFGILSNPVGLVPVLVRLQPVAGVDEGWTLQVYRGSGGMSWTDTGINFATGEVLRIAMDVKVATQSFILRVVNMDTEVEWPAKEYNMASEAGYESFTPSALYSKTTGIIFYTFTWEGATGNISVGADNLYLNPGVPDAIPDPLLERFDELQDQLAVLEGLLSQAEQQNILTDYERVNYTVVKQFIDYGRDQLVVNPGYAQYALVEMEKLMTKAVSQLQAYLSGDKQPLAVPRYVTPQERVTIDGYSFIGDTALSNGDTSGQRPIFFNGYGHFYQVKKDVPNFTGYGTNIIQIDLGPEATVFEPGALDWNGRKIGGSTAQLKIDRTTGYDSTSAIYISNPAPQPGAAAWAYQYYPVERGKKYEIKAMVKGEGVGKAEIFTGLGFTERFALPTGTYDWQEVSYEFTAGDEGARFLGFYIDGLIGKLWLDNISFQEQGSGQNLVLNSGLEAHTEVVTTDEYYTSATNLNNEIVRTLQKAEENNVAVDLLISVHYFPQWALDKWPELQLAGNGFIGYDIQNPKAKKILQDYIETIVPIVSQYKSLHSITLSNEPQYIFAKNSTADVAAWHDYLERVHGSIAHLNAAYGTNYGAFSEVPPQNPDIRQTPIYYDWMTFKNERFAQWHAWLADLVHAIDPDIPVHAKVLPQDLSSGLLHNELVFGVDVEQFAEFSQLNGNDNYNVPGWGTNGFRDYMKFVDLLGSIKEAPVFNSENHLIADGDGRFTAMYAPHARTNLWQSAVHGQSAMTMWVWERVTGPSDPNYSSYGGSVYQRPDVTAAVGQTNLDLNRLAEEVTALQHAPADAAILYALPSKLLSGSYTAASAAAYEALSFSGYNVKFVTEKQVSEGGLDGYQLLVIPGATHVKAETVAGIGDFAEDGGKVVAIGSSVLSKNEYGQNHDAALRNRALENSIPASASVSELRSVLGEQMQALGLERVRIIDASTGKLAQGIEWRTVAYNGKTLVNIANYTEETKEVYIEIDGIRVAQAEELIGNRAWSGSSITLEGLTPYLYSFTPPEGGVRLNYSKLNMNVGEQAQLTATLLPVDDPQATRTWSSSDEDIVSVDAAGLVTAHAVGTANVAVEIAEGGYTASAVVTVIDPNASDRLLADFETDSGYTAGQSPVGVGRWIATPQIHANAGFGQGTVRDREYWSQFGQPPIEGEQSLALQTHTVSIYGLQDYEGNLGEGFAFQGDIKLYTPGTEVWFGLHADPVTGATPALLRFNGIAGTIDAFTSESWVSTGIPFAVGDTLQAAMDIDLIDQTFTIRVLNKTSGSASELHTYNMAIPLGPVKPDILTGGQTGLMIQNDGSAIVGFDNLTMLRERLNGSISRKTQSVMYPASLVSAAVDNAAHDEWARQRQQDIIEAAETWRNMDDDELWALMFAPSLQPRSLMVWSNGFCPATGEPATMYSWEVDPVNHPWKVKCPGSDNWYPTNDFQTFYESGIDPLTGVYDPAKADRSLLFNAEHPDPSDPLHLYGVDDGRGFTDSGNTWYFIGYYQYWGQWKNNVLKGIENLAAAYMATGEQVYAHKAAILLDRVADFYPQFDYATQGLVYEQKGTAGYIGYWVDANLDVRRMVEAYDQIFDGIKADAGLVSFLSGKAAQYGASILNPKTSFAHIQRNIENQIFRDSLRNPSKIFMNYPQYDIAVAEIKTVLNWPESKSEVLNAVKGIIGQSTRFDGLTGEKGLANYSSFAIQELSLLLAKYERVDPDFLEEVLTQYPQLLDAYRFYADTWALDSYYPHVGDSGQFAEKSLNYRAVRLDRPGKTEAYQFEVLPTDPSMYTFFYRLYELTDDPLFMQLLYIDNDKQTAGLPYDLFSDQGATIRDTVDRVITEHGAELNRGSVDKRQWHLSMLRSVDEQKPVAWLNYEAGGQHGHQDGLNLGLYAKGLDLLPDFGYPPVNMDGEWDGQYSAWYRSTLAHNTVVVDGRNQNNAAGATTLWADGEQFRAMRNSAPGLYGIEKYERTVAVSDLSGTDAYVLDIFRVKGGSQHTRFMGSQAGSVATEGLALAPSANIWAGAKLQDVKRDVNPQPGWSVDWSIDDMHNYLPADANVHLKYTDLTKSVEAYVADAWVQAGSYDDPEQMWVPRIATHRSGSPGLESTFVGLIEPYEGVSNVRAVKRLELRNGADQLLPDSYVAVEVELTNGDKDLIIAADPGAYAAGSVLKQAEWNVEAKGELVLIRQDAAGAVKRVAIAKGSEVKVAGTSYGNGAAEFYEWEREDARVGVESIVAPETIRVPYGTAWAGITLPTHVKSQLSDGTERDIDVSWNEASPAYNGNAAGTYTVTGQLVLPEDVDNPDDITVSVAIIVSPAPDTTGPINPGSGTTDPDNPEQPTEEPDPTGKSFADVRAGHWAAKAIAEASARGIIDGYPDGTFRPDQQVSRAEFIHMLVKALGPTGESDELSFKDRSDIPAWARNSIAAAVKAGWVKGYGDGTLRPSETISRAEMAMLVARAAGLKIGANTPTSYADHDNLPVWSRGAIAAVTNAGLMNGVGKNRFSPDQTATRAQAAVLMLRLLEIETD